MCIAIEKKTGYQVLRLTSECISESETNRIIDSVRSALSEGTRCQAISLEAPLSSNIMMMGLLVICEKMVGRFDGHLGLIINPGVDESGLRSLCESLNIEVYDNENAFMMSPAVVAAHHREEASRSHRQSGYLNSAKEFHLHRQPDGSGSEQESARPVPASFPSLQPIDAEFR